ncbi:2'-5'-oligoadenylate synthase 1A-like isoform X2 [Asterias amurensis]|uniref:2'-5'-oligoadenylate synthase 1A-like isoform X2 n=1 Tax=Asterias amurensis TaxID=7602 RepID=UPI003AB877C2
MAAARHASFSEVKDIVRSSEPWCLESSGLGTWYDDHVKLGADAFDRDCRAAVDKVLETVHELCSFNNILFDIDKVVKKKTMLKDMCDSQLVVYINPPYMEPIVTVGTQKYRDQLRRVIKVLMEALKGVESVTEISPNPVSLKFKIRVGYRRLLDVDLYPTADNFRGHGEDLCNMFDAMLQSNEDGRELYTASLIKHQTHFVRSQPTAVIDFIRLVKYWAHDALPDNLKQAYFFELVTIHLWEETGKPEGFSKVQGFKNVMETLASGSTELRKMYWPNLYDNALAVRAIDKLNMHEPVILDPANPTNNVCKIFDKRSNRRAIARAAQVTLDTELLRDIRVRRDWSN